MAKYSEYDYLGAEALGRGQAKSRARALFNANTPNETIRQFLLAWWSGDSIRLADYEPYLAPPIVPRDVRGKLEDQLLDAFLDSYWVELEREELADFEVAQLRARFLGLVDYDLDLARLLPVPSGGSAPALSETERRRRRDRLRRNLR